MSKEEFQQVTHVLVVGSWAKEEITIENLKMNPALKISCYLDTPNTGIIRRVDNYRVGSLYDVEGMISYAKEVNSDLVLVTTAAPLEAGLVDKMEQQGLTVFGPPREAARLESDKAFTRQLMRKHVPHAIPNFRVCATVEEAFEAAELMEWQVAVKPVGLTDGLGVKVFGDQLKDIGEVKDYIREIHHQRISGDSQVIIEEKMTGEEFTIQCFVYQDRVIPTPAVQDFKKLLNGEKGPNTASMGSYSDAVELLPFLNRGDYQQAVQIIQKTMTVFKQETGTWCKGFLYGQFMLTKKGIKLVEFNFRPGDPEWMNTVACLNDNIADITLALINGLSPAPSFKRQATVCKYIVPPEYPNKLNQILDVTLDTMEITAAGANVYCSCGKDEDGRFQVGTERGFAFLATGKTISEAEEKVQNAINSVKGTFYYRSDIGTAPLINSKVRAVGLQKQAEIVFRKAEATDFLDVHDFISTCPPLESYAEHVYKILLRYFGNSCFIAQWRNRIVGFVLGFISQSHTPATYFLWQIGVSPFIHGTGLGSRMLKEVENGVRQLGVERIELTIDPENTPSIKLFTKNGYGNISENVGETVKVKDYPAIKDFYKPGRHFMLFEKQLATRE